MSEQAICWIDGAIMPAARARVAVLDHGFLYGDGVFEGVRYYHRRAFRLTRHLRRLRDSAAAIHLRLPEGEDGARAAVEAVLAAAPLDHGYLRIIVTRGVGELGIDPRGCGRPGLIVIADRLTMIDPARRAGGASLVTATTRHIGPDRLDPRIKSLNYLNSILARIEANQAGADEAVMLNERGRVAEGTADNLFVVRDGELRTPPPSEGALAGVTRETVLELAASLAIPGRETVLAPYDLYTADECFLTGTGARLIPVREIDGRALSACPGPVYRRLAAAYDELVELETGT